MKILNLQELGQPKNIEEILDWQDDDNDNDVDTTDDSDNDESDTDGADAKVTTIDDLVDGDEVDPDSAEPEPDDFDYCQAFIGH